MDQETRFRISHALRVKGLAPAAAVARGTGLPEDIVRSCLADLESDGLVRCRNVGCGLTPAGVSVHGTLLSLAVSRRATDVLEAVYPRFLPLNGRLKQACADWQILAGRNVPNDHRDPDYDKAVIARLEVVDRAVTRPLAELASELSWMSAYRSRLADALTRLLAGERAAFTSPMAESYHDIWMELHQDLLVSAGRRRDSGDE